MTWLYLVLNLGSVVVPLSVSGLLPNRLTKHWKPFLLSTAITACIFLLWDVLFTASHVWGFNSNYHLGIELFGLPFEEYLFFFCIPFASLYIHFSLEEYKESVQFSSLASNIVTITIAVAATIILALNFDRLYTRIDMIFLLVVLFALFFRKKHVLNRFYASFLIVLIPFVLVNGILTGSWIPDEVVWYNNEENLGIRLWTIPLEDIAYAFSMLGLNLWLFEEFVISNLRIMAK